MVGAICESWFFFDFMTIWACCICYTHDHGSIVPRIMLPYRSMRCATESGSIRQFFDIQRRRMFQKSISLLALSEFVITPQGGVMNCMINFCDSQQLAKVSKSRCLNDGRILAMIQGRCDEHDNCRLRSGDIGSPTTKR